MAKKVGGRPDRLEVLALLRAIKETPEDDAPRLILADWLEEHGEPDRAEFIRLQCRLAQVPLGLAPPARLAKRESDLLGEHAAAWGAAFAAPRSEVRFRRGLLHLRLTERAFLARERQKLAGTETWAWVESLAFPHLERPAEVVTSPVLADLVSLDLAQCYLGAEGMKALADSPHLGTLTTLKLYRNEFGLEGLQALLRAPSLARLCRLDLTWNHFGDRGAEVLAPWPRLAGLTSLELGGK
jgi:uncharacterized protein (TIGR02996 family)